MAANAGPLWQWGFQDRCPGLLDSQVWHVFSAHLRGPGGETQEQTGLGSEQCGTNPSSHILGPQCQQSHQELSMTLATEHRVTWILTHMATWWATHHQPPDSLGASNSQPS